MCIRDSGDIVEKIPVDAETLCESDKHCAGFINTSGAKNKFMAFQFHPEVTHTKYGTEMLKYFCQKAAGLPTVSYTHLDVYKRQKPSLSSRKS